MFTGYLQDVYRIFTGCLKDVYTLAGRENCAYLDLCDWLVASLIQHNCK